MTPIRCMALSSTLFALFAMTACSPHPSGAAAVNELAPAFCQQLQTCDARNYLHDFPTDRPNDNSACIQHFETTVSTSGQSEACTQAQLDKCTADIRALSCVDFNADVSASKLPPSCDGC